MCKAPADMRGLAYYGSFMDDAVPPGSTLNGAAYLDGGFGARLAGADDSISVDLLDYSSRGRFSIAFWMTQTQCRIPGRYEMIFSHSHHSGNWWSSQDNPNIHVWAMCGDEGGYSTLGGSIIRVLMVDDDGQRGVFDWSLGSAKSGGFLTDAWLHFALSVSSKSVTVYVDGQPLRARSDRRWDGHVRDLTGSQTRTYGPTKTRHRSPAPSRPARTSCRAEGYSYFGLQWRNQCTCDNEYGMFGRAAANFTDNADNLPGCDVDGDGTPDCGYGRAGPPGMINPDLCDDDGNCPELQACGWRNAIYDLSGSAQSIWAASLTGASLPRASRPRHARSAPWMEGCGWNGRRGICEQGGYTSSWECTVADYGSRAHAQQL